jgi:hypothetical protein
MANRFPTEGPLDMLTIATGLQVPLPPTNSISMSDFGTKGIMRTWDAAGNSTPIPVAGSGIPPTSLSIAYFRGKYYRNPAIPPNTVPYYTSQSLTTAPIIDGSSPIRFDYTIVGGGGGGGSGGGGYAGSSGSYGGGGGGGGGSGGITSGSGIPYSSGSVNITVGSGGNGAPGGWAYNPDNRNNGSPGGITMLQIGGFSVSVSNGNGGDGGYYGEDGTFVGGRGGRGGEGGSSGPNGNSGGKGSNGGTGEITHDVGGGSGGGGGGGYTYSGFQYGRGGDGSGGGRVEYTILERDSYPSGDASRGNNGIVVITWYYN